MGRRRTGQDPPALAPLFPEHTGLCLGPASIKASWGLTLGTSVPPGWLTLRPVHLPAPVLLPGSFQGLIFVVDSNDRERINEAKDELNKMVRAKKQVVFRRADAQFYPSSLNLGLSWPPLPSHDKSHAIHSWRRTSSVTPCSSSLPTNRSAF